MENENPHFEVRIIPDYRRQKGDNSWPCNCRVIISEPPFEAGRLLRDYSVTIPQLLSDNQESELSWYLESYAQDDVLATERAAAVERRIGIYAQKLSTLLVRASGDVDWVKEALLNVVVFAPEGGTSPLLRLHWETLETIPYWKPSIRPQTVVVTRGLFADPLQGALGPSFREDDFTNILLVSARPQLDRDVPYRLASSVLFSALDRLHAEDRAKIRVTIVRPGTFENFTNLLFKFPPGHFDIVHFDLHGVDTSNGIALAFLKYTPNGIAPDYVPGEKLAQVLGQSQVRSVILNACRSAGSRGNTEFFVSELIKGGVWVVVGMTFDAIASSIELFLEAMYHAYIHLGCPLPLACHLGRCCLDEDQRKLTRFGNFINIVDAFVPVCYVKGLFRHSSEHVPRIIKLAHPLDDGPNATAQSIFGRENDILLLETHFLWSSNVAILQGPAGIGKTALLNYACEWWIKTGAIEEFARIDLVVEQGAVMRNGLQAVVRAVLKVPDSMTWDSVVDRLRSRRYCLCVDSLESIAYLDSKIRLKLRQEVKALVKALVGGQSIIMVASRRDEPWVSSNAYDHHVGGINPAAIFQYVRAVADEIGLKISFDDKDQLHYLERIAKLVDRNPLVLYALLQELRIDSSDFRTFYYALVGGKRSLQDISWAEHKDGARSILELSRLITSLDLLHVFETARELGLLETMPVDEKRNFRESLLEPLLEYSLPENCLPPYLMALFWNHLPVSSLGRYMMFCALEAAGREHVAVILAACPDSKPPRTWISQKEGDFFRTFDQDCVKEADRMILPLQRLGLISHGQEGVHESSTELYYELHPLVTLLSRKSVVYQLKSDELGRAFARLQAHKMRDWPWRYDFANEKWKPCLKQASMDFTNNLCAAIILLGTSYSTLWTHTIFLRVLSSIQKSLVLSPQHQAVVITVWTTTYNAMLDFPREKFYRYDSGYQAREDRAQANFLCGTGAVSPEELEKTELACRHLCYYNRQYFLMYVSSTLVTWQKQGYCKGPKIDRERLLNIINDAPDFAGLRSDGKDELAEMVAHMSQRPKVYMEVMKLLEKVVEDSPGKVLTTKEFETSLKRITEEGLKPEYDFFGVQEFDQGRFNLNLEEGTLVQKARSGMNPSQGSTRGLSWVKHVVNDHLDAGNYSEARETIYDALNTEINFQGDHETTRTELMWLLANVDKAAGKAAHVKTSLIDGIEPPKSFSDERSSMEKLQQFLKLARTAEGYGKADGVKTYVKKILHLANRAAVDNEPEVEVKAIMGLHELEITHKFESPISDIFLFLRGAKSQYRLGGPRLRVGKWLSSITNSIDRRLVQWTSLTFGDGQGQLTLISNMFRLFTSLTISSPECSVLLFKYLHDNEKIDMLLHDMEERVFAAPGIAPACRLVSSNCRFPEESALMEFIYLQGMRYLERASTGENMADMVFPVAPHAPVDLISTLGDEDYRYPTRLALRLAGYVVDW